MFPAEVLVDHHTQYNKNDVIITKEQRHSDSTSRIRLQTNVLFLRNRPMWKLYSYEVKFKPTLDSKILQKVVLKQHAQDIFGEGGWSNVIFDGTKLWTRALIDQDEAEDEIEFDKWTSTYRSELRDGTAVKFRFKLLKAHEPTDPICLQVYNLHFKRYQEILEMKEINRDYYFHKLAEPVVSKGHKFQVWPGLIARINQFEYPNRDLTTQKITGYEDKPGLLVDTKSKIVRQESCYEAIKVLRAFWGFRDPVVKT